MAPTATVDREDAESSVVTPLCRVESQPLFVEDGEADGPVNLGGDLDLKAANRNEAARFAGELAELADAVSSDADRQFLTRLRRTVTSDGLNLPPMPQTVIRVQRLIDSPNANFKDLASEIELDPALTTKMVGIANSPFYQGMDPARSVQDAIVRVGLRETRNIIMAIVFRSKLFRVPGYDKQVQELWVHSMAASITSQQIAGEIGGDPDSAFLGGLTHDLGRVIIFSIAGEIGRETRGRLRPDPGLLRDLLERFHSLLGSIAAGSWRFAPDLVAAIGCHHCPEETPASAAELASVLCAGDRLARWIVADKGEELPSDEEWVALTSPICLDPDLKEQVIEEIRAAYRKLEGTLTA